MSFFSKILGDANARFLNKFKPLIVRINELEENFASFGAEELKMKTGELKERFQKGESLDELLPEAFALVREASKKTLGQRHFDVQLLGGMVIHQGKIAEMRTGEGKTLVATLPAYLNALTGKGVHIVTVNDYLSRRDAVWMGQIYSALGVFTGVINHESSFIYDPSHRTFAEGEVSSQARGLSERSASGASFAGHSGGTSPEANPDSDPLDKTRDETGSFHVVHEFLRPVTRREAYSADITYGTNNEFGFDYLRDNL